VGADGKFVIDRVPPGLGLVGRQVSLAIGQLGHQVFDDHSVPVDIAAGKPVMISVGGTGPDVTGQVEPPPGSTWRLADTYAHVKLWPSERAPNVPELFKETETMAPAQQKVEIAAWAKTPEGQAWMVEARAYDQRRDVTYSSGFRGDGVLELLEVPPGKYWLRADVMTLDRAPGSNSQKQLGWLLQEIVVPEVGAGKKVDLGHFVLKKWAEAGGG
jgi:hypothetical protein